MSGLIVQIQNRRKPLQIVFFAVILVVLFGVAVPVQAQETVPPGESACVTCHELLYYNYDQGKWFCQCNQKMDCTCCHGGDPTALTEEEAHLNMVVHAADQEGLVCQECHETDYADKVATFSEIAGIGKVHTASLRPAEVQPPVVVENPAASTGMFAARSFAPWQIAGLGLLGVGLAAVVWCGFNCWRKDQNS